MGVRRVIKIGQIPAESIEHVWDNVTYSIQHVLDMFDNNYTIDYVKQQIENGRWWLVLATKDSKLIGTFVCSNEETSHGNVLFIHIAAGEPMSQWRDPIIDFMKQGARACGASAIEWRGRKGMIKAFQDVAKIRHVAMTISVENENG